MGFLGAGVTAGVVLYISIAAFCGVIAIVRRSGVADAPPPPLARNMTASAASIDPSEARAADDDEGNEALAVNPPMMRSSAPLPRRQFLS